MKYIVVLLALVLSSFISFGQNSKETIKGKVEKKECSKSTESYCAQGSEYFVIMSASGTIVLESKKDLSSCVGKEVEITGHYKEKEVSNENEMSQKPISTPNLDGSVDEFKCNVFVVEKVK